MSESDRNVGYCLNAPSENNAFWEPFPANEWTSSVPGVGGPGSAPLFEDSRISWAIQQLGGIGGWDILELGPLEGGHTWMMEEAGAFVTAIEGNIDAFLRCLIVKNHLGLRSKFLLGDFGETLGLNGPWDLVNASGVLYHMSDPVKLLREIAASSERLLMWTHYWEPNLDLWSPALAAVVSEKWDWPNVESIEFCKADTKGHLRVVKQRYETDLERADFCGGAYNYSKWIFREDLLDFLRYLGYSDLKIAFDQPDHPHGPAFQVLAQRG